MVLCVVPYCRPSPRHRSTTIKKLEPRICGAANSVGTRYSLLPLRTVAKYRARTSALRLTCHARPQPVSKSAVAFVRKPRLASSKRTSAKALDTVFEFMQFSSTVRPHTVNDVRVARGLLPPMIGPAASNRVDCEGKQVGQHTSYHRRADSYQVSALLSGTKQHRDGPNQIRRQGQ